MIVCIQIEYNKIVFTIFFMPDQPVLLYIIVYGTDF